MLRLSKIFKTISAHKPIHRNILSKFCAKTNFLAGDNAIFVDEMYSIWLEDPNSVHPSWDQYFNNVEAGEDPNSAYFLPPTLGMPEDELKKTFALKDQIQRQLGGNLQETNCQVQEKLSRLFMKYRDLGHEIARVNPIESEEDYSKRKSEFKDLEDSYEYHDFTPEELDIPFKYASEIQTGIHTTKKVWTPREAAKTMNDIYCGPISFQHTHIAEVEVRNWIRNYIEKIPQVVQTPEEKEYLLDRILESQTFTNFCETKFPSAKRFGIDGLDSVISGLEMMVDRAKEHGVRNVCLGMAHRGRLNTLVSVCDKPYETMFGEFKDKKGTSIYEDEEGFSGDVKYHLGSSSRRKYPDGETIQLTLMPNPSHLETVNTVTMGKARAKMDFLGDRTGDQVMACTIHGDAAFSGQGVVYEMIQMEKLKGYHVGGTIHVITNNQVGFTTNPVDARSSQYVTDLAKTINGFVIHVNADRPEYVDYAFKLAVDYRNKFKRDVFVDVIGYRKYGHNEQDMPKFTQPKMYKTIETMKPMWLKYCEQLINEGFITQEKIDEKIAGYKSMMQEALDKSERQEFRKPQMEDQTWTKYLSKPKDDH